MSKIKEFKEKLQSLSKKKVYWSLFGLLATIVVATSVYYGFKDESVYVQVRPSKISATPLKKGATPDSLYLYFNSSVAPLKSIGEVVKTGIQITPEVKGMWKWQSDKKLVFKPQNDWPEDEELEIRFLEGFFPNHVRLERDSLNVPTPKFTSQISSLEFYQSPVNPKEKKIIATFKFSHPVSSEALKKNIFIELMNGGKKEDSFLSKIEKLRYELDFDEFHGKAFLRSENLTPPQFDQNIKLTVHKDSLSSSGVSAVSPVSRSLRIPGMENYFKITGIQSRIVRDQNNSPDQVLIIESSALMQIDDLEDHLDVYLLPKDKPALPYAKKVKNHRWSVNDVSNEIVSQSQKVSLKRIEGQNFSKIRSFKLDQPTDRYLYIKVSPGMKSFGEYILTKAFNRVLKVPRYPKDLEILNQGSLLSFSGEKKITVLARGIQNATIKVSRIKKSQIMHLITQTYGDFTFKNHSFDESNISEISRDVWRFKSKNPKRAQYANFDFSSFFKEGRNSKAGLFFFEVKEGDGKRYIYNAVRQRRLILVTDLGLLVKRSVKGEYDIFVQSVSKGRPVNNAKVSVLSKNGSFSVSKFSDRNGHVHLPQLHSFKNEEQPVAFLVTKGSDLSLIPYNTHVQNVDYSNFEVGGERSGSARDQVKAYLFSDRGIYRPGEEIKIGAIFKQKNWKQSVANLPLEIQVFSPRGNNIKTQRVFPSKVGLQDFSFSTHSASETGSYTINAYLIKHANTNRSYRVKIGATQVKVEEFLPDQMRITSRFNKDWRKGWVKPENLKGEIQLQNLFGAPAKDHRVVANMILLPKYPSFREFKEYEFYDPSLSKKKHTLGLPENRTDQEGKASFDLPLNQFDQATYLVEFLAEGFMKDGGRSVSTSKKILVSPREFLIGYKPDGRLSYISKDSERSVHLLAINSNIQSQAQDGLKLKLFETRSISTLMKQENGTYKYQTVEKKDLVEELPLQIGEKGYRLPLPTAKAGDFQFVILNKDDEVLNQFRFSIAGEGNIKGNLEKNAELQLKLEKEDYNPGESISVSIRSPYVGAGLITIERDKVYAYKWFKTNSTSSVQQIRVPEKMEGNGYINVTFLRSIQSDEIYMSPFSTAVKPFLINQSKRLNKIDLRVKEEIKSGEILDIKFSSERKGKIVIFSVNQGILQVAKYQKPDPLSHFFKKKALEVNTRQILDLLMPEYGILQEKLKKIGGGARSKRLLASNLNPFQRKLKRPVAYWSGVLDSGPETRSAQFKVPDHFNGQLKTFAVVVSPQSMGVDAEDTYVKSDFIIRPNLPTFAAPKDKFTISVGVFNNLKGSGVDAPLNIELQTSPHLTVEGDAIKKVKISEEEEQSIHFDVSVNSKLGSASLKFKVWKGEVSSKRELSMSIRPLTRYRTKLQNGYVSAGSSEVIQSERKLYPELHEKKLSISSVPLALSSGLANYLSNYPYGCTEQIISKSFPALVLQKTPEFGYSKEKIDKQLEVAFSSISRRMNSQGGLGIWENSSNPSAFHTIYTAHFLIEAKKRNWPFPQYLMRKSLSYIKKYVGKVPRNTVMAMNQAYGVYVLTQSGVVMTRELIKVKEYLEKNDKNWKNDVSALYIASSYKLMKSDQKAEDMMDSFKLGEKIDSIFYDGLYDDTSKNAQYLYLTSLHFPEIAKEISEESLLMILKPLLAGSYNTINSAYSILAFDAYSDLVGKPSLEKLSIKAVQENGKVRELKFAEKIFASSDFPLKSKELQVKNDSAQALFYSTLEAGYNLQASQKAQNSNLEVSRVIGPKSDFLDSGEKIKRGDELAVKLRYRSLSGGNLYNLAIVDLLPAGFEIQIDSVDRKQAEYVDIREDRIVVFTSANSSVKEFNYKIKAINKGRYQVPPLYGESMYDNSIYSITKTKNIVVE